jgi:nicotinate-nucleotide adenylyltransferase
MNIGVLGGTFDPIHIGHLTLAAVVREKLCLAEVVFVPAGNPYFKVHKSISAAEHRLAMVRLAIAENPGFKISLLEVDRPGPSYTVNTLSEMRRGLSEDDELFFILGWDILAELPEWRQPARLISLCHLVAVPRVGYNLPKFELLEAAIPGITERVLVLDEPRINISSSVIRERLARGLPVQRLVPDSVADYIHKHGLYQDRGAGSD